MSETCCSQEASRVISMLEGKGGVEKGERGGEAQSQNRWRGEEVSRLLIWIRQRRGQLDIRGE